MKSILIVVCLCLLMGCKSTKIMDIKACRDFEERYKKIQNYHRGKSSLQMDEITKMVRLTGIEVDHNFSIDIDYYLTKRNLKDWKKWYQRNKQRLSWEEETQRIKLLSEPKDELVEIEVLASSHTKKKELFSSAYVFLIIDMHITEINPKNGYYHLRGVNGKDTLDLITPRLSVLVREKKKRRWREIKVNEVYEFDLLAIYKPRDFGGLLQPNEIELLIQGNYSSTKHMGPKYYRILNRYGYEK
ncbi:hypothetical protein HX004_08405 [Myroides sp. 1354]|nr:hypothetical protein [Myroides sp. R163-1]MDM1055792.1 hypothetical protein [Myroides sp. 1354]MDM1069973.1 hypothetical protein [Myroides sp. 1372]